METLLIAATAAVGFVSGILLSWAILKTILFTIESAAEARRVPDQVDTVTPKSAPSPSTGLSPMQENFSGEGPASGR